MGKRIKPETEIRNALPHILTTLSNLRRELHCGPVRLELNDDGSGSIGMVGRDWRYFKNPEKLMELIQTYINETQ